MSQPLPKSAPRFDTPLLRPFYEGLAAGVLRLPACSVCGAWQWYPYAFVKCHAEAQHRWTEVGNTGTVFTFTTVRRSLMPDADQAVVPYVSALVEIDGVVGPRLATVLVNLGARAPAIGMHVRLAVSRVNGYDAAAFEPFD